MTNGDTLNIKEALFPIQEQIKWSKPQNEP
jgi:hypothetical protein